MNICEICKSLIFDGKCSNKRCGTGNNVKWNRNDRNYNTDFSRGNQLITADRPEKPTDLGGPSLGIAHNQPRLKRYNFDLAKRNHNIAEAKKKSKNKRTGGEDNGRMGEIVQKNNGQSHRM